MKAHSGADSASGIVHSASVTAANVHDSQNSRLYGDSVYGKQKEALKAKVPKARDFTNKRACRNKPLTERDKEVNRTKSQTRAKVEHPFLTPKRICGFAKVRYRGLTNNANRVFAMMALLNIDK